MNNKKRLFKIYNTNRQLYTLMYEAEHEGAFVCHIRCSFCSNLNEFFREVSSSLRFPYYFGYNWNAFDECITDLEWLKFTSLVVVFDNYDVIFCEEVMQRFQQDRLIKHFLNAVEYWQIQDVPVYIYINQLVD